MLRNVVVRRSLPFLITFLCAGSAAAQETGGTISGQVTDSISRSPLAAAEVTLGDPGAVNVRTTRTNAEGRYTFTSVPAGLTTVSVRMVGFTPRGRRVTVRN